jgi:diguanylate cyclase (GGDEF)-like protein
MLHSAPPFRLVRYFSVASLGLIALIGLLLSLGLRQRAETELLHMAERRNEAMAAVFLNALGGEFEAALREPGATEAAALRARSQVAGWQAKTAALMAGSEVVKVKVFNLQGLTIFSSEAGQIGEDKRDNPGFVSARSGSVRSALTHRDRFDAFEGERVQIDVIGSYIPFRRDAQIVGVFEVYQDVTAFVQRQHKATRDLALLLVATLLLLYGLQLLLVRHAQRQLDGQQAALRRANDELEARVAARTADLEQASARLAHLAHHDALTGLPNRLACNEHLRRACALAERNERQLALLYIDLDRFKEVNDSLGHGAGDTLLREVATRLAQTLRRGDLLARIGGDEFVCVLDCGVALTEAPQLAERLIAALASPLAIAGQAFQLSASVGISVYPADGASAEALFHAADAAMYAAKAEGRNHYQFYRPELTQVALDRAHLLRLLRRAQADDELSLHFQMKLRAADGRPAGAEALLRWQSAELGAVPPLRFITIAEESGLINALGAWVLEQACHQLVAWDAAGLQLPHVSVNLSVRQLERGDFVEQVQRVLEQTGLAPQRLELEITESVILQAGDALERLAALDRLGVRLAVDDFGTGYSSLAYLKRMPIEALKIDRSFVAGIGEQLGDEALVRTVIALARSLGLATVAEGVETEAQADFLRFEGCDQLQGFLFSRPLPADDFLGLWGRAAG